MSYKRWLFIAIILFSLGLVSGLAVLNGITGVLAEDVAEFEEFARFLSSLPQATVMGVIFIKNASVLLVSFILSPIFCLVPILALTVNGWLLGFISATVIKEASLGYLLAGLLPHGIFELPALIMGEAVALSFGAAFFLALFQKEKRNLLLSNLRQNLRYLIIAFLLLVPAAIIEAYITPLLLP